MVNINIEIPDELHKELKLRSLLTDRSLKAFVIEALDRGIPEVKLR